MNTEERLAETKKAAVRVCRTYAALLALDWQRLEELREAEYPTQSESDERQELEELLGDCGVSTEDEAYGYLLDVPLEITCTATRVSLSDWPLRYPQTVEILLATGGPAYRLVVDLHGGRGGVEVAAVQVQDWFTPWEDATSDPDIIAELLPLAEFWTDSLFSE